VGATGDFEVLFEGKPVFSKRAANRFPDSGEVEAAIKQLIKTK
jgi:hypothetical protein